MELNFVFGIAGGLVGPGIAWGSMVNRVKALEERIKNWSNVEKSVAKLEVQIEFIYETIKKQAL